MKVRLTSFTADGEVLNEHTERIEDNVEVNEDFVLADNPAKAIITVFQDGSLLVRKLVVE